ncbi:MAG: hypothetical protein IPG76_22935 [Acidobacteria bacterium]|nr:hypothetical protein [Acidobacteriota bacterium]
MDIYLNLAATSTNDTRFDFTSAVNQPSGPHRRDFAFNAGFYNDTDVTGSGPRFVVSASKQYQSPGAFPKNPGRARLRSLRPAGTRSCIPSATTVAGFSLWT